MASETTAAAAGAVGVVRRDPMAMLPFCGYNMGDYFNHWIEMGKKITNKPKIFNTNWFRTSEDGKFLWPGFGDNLRVLEWILKRCEDEIGADETAIGYVPKAEDINREGIEDEVSIETLRNIFSVDADLWKEDAANLEQFYAKIQSVGNRMPKEMYDQLEGLKSRLG